MKLILKTALILGVTASAAMAQVITPMWVEHLNGETGVNPADRLPILRKNVGGLEAPNGVADGTSQMVTFGNMLRYDSERFLLMVRQNGINETDASIPQADKDLAVQYPDASLIWINATNGKPMGIAHVFGVTPITVTGQGAQYDFFQDWGISDDGVLYSTHKNVILRWAKDGTDKWSTTSTCAWTEPTEGAQDCSGAALDGTSGGDGNQSWRWRDFRVQGSGVNTVLLGGGGTWRASHHLQIFQTTNGTTFFPISRNNDRDGGYKGNYSQGGNSSSAVKHKLDPARPNLTAVYHARFPGTGWEARPDRFLEDLDNPFRTVPDTYNTDGLVAMFETGEAWNWSFTNNNKGDVLNYPATPAGPNGQWGNLPAFRWEAAGKDGIPIDHAVDGATRYDGNWACSLDANDSLDYIINYAMPSWNNQFGDIKKPGWIAAHRLDGSISYNSSWNMPCTEMDIATPDESPSTEPTVGNTWGYCGAVNLYPDTTAATNLQKAMLTWSGGAYGFGVFTVQNVAAVFTTPPPATATWMAGTTNTLTATLTGSPIAFQWYKNGLALADGRYIRGAKTATLTLLEVIKDDAGTYMLEVNNPLSGKSSTSSTVTIVGAYVRPHQNAAALGTASQISTYPGGDAWKANDGNTNQAWGGGSVAHTAGDTNAAIWWEVDLKSTMDIGRVVYFPRSDCCDDRQADLNVVILDASRNEVNRTNISTAGFLWPDSWTQDYTPMVPGRYVRIERIPTGAPDPNTGIPSDAFLNIAEVQVLNKFRPVMDIGIYNGQIMVAWDSDAFSTPKLQQSDSLPGGWTDVTTTTPYSSNLSATPKFYRLVEGP